MRRLRLRLLSFLERQIGDLHAAQVADRLAQHQLAVVMDVRLDVVAVELIDHALRLGLEALAIFRRPPVIQPALRVEL